GGFLPLTAGVGLIGLITLDGEGDIAATEMGLPNFLTARGTSYRAGIVSEGIRAAVILGPGGVLLHYEAPQELNPSQPASLLAYENSPENRVARERLLEEYPYLVDTILERGFGEIILEFNTILNHCPVRLALVSEGERYRFVHLVGPGEAPPPNSMAVVH